MKKNKLRDKIESQNDFSRIPDSLIEKIFEVFRDNEEVGDVMRTLEDLNHTYNLLKKAGLSWIISKKISSLSEGEGTTLIRKELAESRERFYSPIGNLEIPKDIKEMTDNSIVAYHINSGITQELDIQSPLEFILTNYITYGPEQTFESIRNLPSNIRVRNRISDEGADMDAFERGKEKDYLLKPDNGFIEGIKSKVYPEIESIYNEMNRLGIHVDNPVEISLDSLIQELKKSENVLRSNRFESEKESLRIKLKKRIQNVKSKVGFIRSLEDNEINVQFYVSQDPLESLHLGQYFGSCLSLSKLVGTKEAWGSVVQTMDSNKNVIYAKCGDKYVGRNRTVLTDKGILCTRFYPKRDTRLNNEWIDYLESFSEQTNQEIMIPTKFTKDGLGILLEKRVFWKKAKKESRTVRIYPAYFNAFHSDGLDENKTPEGIEISSEVYVLRK